MRSMFSSFPTEKVRLIKRDGSIIDDIEALVESKMIFVDDANILIEEGDFFERTLPNGAKEEYEVIDRGFYKGMPGVPDHYQVEVQKTTARLRNSSITYNIHNETGRVNINSVDNSVNVQMSKNEEALFSTLLSLASRIENNTEIVKAINEMHNEVGKETFISKYNGFIQSIANHMTIFAPFIPAISNFLVK